MTRQNETAVALLILGAVFLCIGVVQGGCRDAFQKTIRACLERIGIG